MESSQAQEISPNVAGPLVTLETMKIYRGFPERLHHSVPHRVEIGALFHIRIRLDRDKPQTPLTDPLLAQAILDSAKFYEARVRWHITLFLLMPDHLHAVLSFQRDKSMSEIIRDWKRFHKRANRIVWQEGYFDHRLRDDERGTQLSAKPNYIRQNPVAAGLCAKRKTGNGSSIHSGARSEVDRLLRRRWLVNRRRRRYQAANATYFSQRVEDNAFHQCL